MKVRFFDIARSLPGSVQFFSWPGCHEVETVGVVVASRKSTSRENSIDASRFELTFRFGCFGQTRSAGRCSIRSCQSLVNQMNGDQGDDKSKKESKKRFPSNQCLHSIDHWENTCVEMWCLFIVLLIIVKSNQMQRIGKKTTTTETRTKERWRGKTHWSTINYCK